MHYNVIKPPIIHHLFSQYTYFLMVTASVLTQCSSTLFLPYSSKTLQELLKLTQRGGAPKIILDTPPLNSVSLTLTYNVLKQD